MRPFSMQYLYLGKPAALLLLITVISVFLWIGLGDFYTKGEPREASVAVSMIEKQQWILPEVYADEIAYKPPLMHWLTAVFSLSEGKVTPFTSRLPSAIAFLGLVVCSFLFFGARLRMQESFLAALILLTAFELHRAAMTSRVDMLLTFLIVGTLIRLFNWEEQKKLEGFPWLASFFMSLSVLTKGPVGIVLPLLVFSVYLLFLRYNVFKIAIKLVPLILFALILPLVWYFLSYLKGEKDFLYLVWAENFGRFFHIENLNIQYELGHEESWWYNLTSLAAGFLPWTFLLAISLFGLSYRQFFGIQSFWNSLIQIDKVKFFSALSTIIIVLFYSLPASKRSVYLMPAYPFISIFIARYILYLTEYKPKIIKFFACFIGIFACLTGFAALLTVIAKWFIPENFFDDLTTNTALQAQISHIWRSIYFPQLQSFLLFIILFFSIFYLFKSFRKKFYLKTLYSIFGVYLSLFLVIDGLFLPAYKNAISLRAVAENIEAHYPVTEYNMFVMNNLLEYRNMYGLNFYLHNSFRNFEKESPSEGYFLTGKNDFEKVLQNYKTHYNFSLLEEFPNYTRDGEKVVQLYFFKIK